MKLLSLPEIILVNLEAVEMSDDGIKYPFAAGNDLKFTPINVQFDDFREMTNFINDRNKDRYNPYKIISERITIDGYDFMKLDIDTINVNKLTAVLTYNFVRKRKTQ